jgi:hypothetical protein
VKLSATLSISLRDDSRIENTETFNVKITSAEYINDDAIVEVADDVAVVSISDNDPVNKPDDDDLIERYDPLALDIDKDGVIDTYSLEDSIAYFDITGDGIREKIGWVKDNDALLVYDKNENGRIDGVDEVFGNLTKKGFDELRELINSDGNNTIDKY